MRILQSRILFHEKNRRNIPMQKIAFHLNSLQQGGAERVVSNLANRFAKEGYEVVIATEWYGTDEFALDQKVRRVHVGLTKEDEKPQQDQQDAAPYLVSAPFYEKRKSRTSSLPLPGAYCTVRWRQESGRVSRS